jgi:hypothetical protein
MTGRQFYDWQTAGGADDVMRMVDALERAGLPWCAIGGMSVNHWAAEPMVTRDVDFVVAVDEVERAIAGLQAVGFTPERHQWSVSVRGRSQVSLQLSTEDFYRDFPSRSVPADAHGILLRVASLDAGRVRRARVPVRMSESFRAGRSSDRRLFGSRPGIGREPFETLGDADAG